MVLIPSIKEREHGLQLASDYWSQAHRKWLTGQIWQKKLAWNLATDASRKLNEKKIYKIGVTFSHKRLHFGNFSSQLNFLKLLESCHFNANERSNFMKILQGKKWDQINRRDEVLEYKTHKCKNAMFSFTKRECLSKNVALHSLGLQL